MNKDYAVMLKAGFLYQYPQITLLVGYDAGV